MKLNERQKEAVIKFDTDLLVMAGAGTGKTGVLTHKYMYLLKTKKCEVPQIVAVTFTRKAADEMRARIREQLKNEYRISSGKEQEFWSRQQELLEVSSHITTIHGLCFSILTQHPVEAGIDPQVTVLDEGEEYLLKAKVAKNALSALLTGDEAKSMLQVVLSLGSNFFLENLTGLYSALKDAGEEIETLSARGEATRNETDLEELKSKLFSEIELLKNKSCDLKLTSRAEQLLSDFFSRWTELKAEVVRAESLVGNGLEAMEDILSYLPKNLNQQLKPELERVHGIIAFIKTALATKEAAAQKPVLMKYLRLFDQEYTEIKRAEGKVDFTDQQFLVRKLLREYPRIREEYKNRFYYLMVDEFQDTNSLQWEIIRLLSGEGYQGGRLFLVGDLKQSIYRFRGAEVEIMTKLAETYPNAHGQVLVLDQNYRTKPQVAAVINEVCHTIFATEDFPYHPLLPVESTPASLGGAGAEILLAADHEPMMLAARLKNMVDHAEVMVREAGGARPVQYRDLALLFRARTNIKLFEEAFITYRIPYIVNAGTGFYARQEIQDQLNLVRLVECKDDALALAGVLRSPFCQLSDAALFWLGYPDGLTQGFFKEKGFPHFSSEISLQEKARIARLHNLLELLVKNAHLLSIPTLLRIAWEETGYLETVAALPGGERSLANLEKLMLRAEEFAAKGYSEVGEFGDFLRHLSALEVREGEASVSNEQGNVVQMMTVHAAKGLEFPVVVLPELERKFSLIRRSPVTFHKNWGVVHKVRDQEGKWLDTDLTLKAKATEERAEISELKRLFYVGMTRARDYLLFSGKEKEVMSTCIDQGDSWLDWLVQILPGMTEKKEELLSIGEGRIKVTREVSLPSVSEQLGKGEETVESEIASTLELPLLTRKLTTRRLSLTPLLTFQECPRRFFWEHRLGSDPHLASIHTSENQVGGNYSVILGEVFHRVISGSSHGKEFEETDWVGWFQRFSHQEQVEALAHLKVMRENYLRSSFFPQAEVRVENEYPFLLDLKGVVIKGIIDRILFYPDGSFVVVDFKTNRQVPKPGKILDRYFFQVYLYSLALREIHGCLPTEAWIYFVRPDIKVPCSLNERNLVATEKKILEDVEYITEHDLPADHPPGENCEFCPFTFWCKESFSSS